MHLRWGVVPCFIPTPHQKKGVGLCLLYFEQLVKGNQGNEGNGVFLWALFCASSLGETSCCSSLWQARVFGAGSAVGEARGPAGGSHCAGWLCPDLCGALLIHLCPAYKLWAQAHPPHPACSGCCIREKASCNSWVFSLEIKPIQAPWKPLPLEGESGECKVGWVSPPLPSCRNEPDLRDSASSFPPMHLRHTQRTRHSLWFPHPQAGLGVGYHPDWCFPGVWWYVDSFSAYEIKKLTSRPHLRVIEPIFKRLLGVTYAQSSSKTPDLGQHTKLQYLHIFCLKAPPTRAVFVSLRGQESNLFILLDILSTISVSN